MFFSEGDYGCSSLGPKSRYWMIRRWMFLLDVCDQAKFLALL